MALGDCDDGEGDGEERGESDGGDGEGDGVGVEDGEVGGPEGSEGIAAEGEDSVSEAVGEAVGVAFDDGAAGVLDAVGNDARGEGQGEEGEFFEEELDRAALGGSGRRICIAGLA